MPSVYDFNSTNPYAVGGSGTSSSNPFSTEGLNSQSTQNTYAPPQGGGASNPYAGGMGGQNQQLAQLFQMYMQQQAGSQQPSLNNPNAGSNQNASLGNSTSGGSSLGNAGNSSLSTPTSTLGAATPQNYSPPSTMMSSPQTSSPMLSNMPTQSPAMGMFGSNPLLTSTMLGSQSPSMSGMLAGSPIY